MRQAPGKAGDRALQVRRRLIDDAAAIDVSIDESVGSLGEGASLVSGHFRTQSSSPVGFRVMMAARSLLIE